MTLHTWLIYLLAATGLSLSPGPNGLLALTHGALHGRRKALYTVFGGALGFVTVIALSMFGIGALLKASLAWLGVMKWLGGAYLVWLGIQVWRSPPIGIELRGTAQPRAGVVAVPAGRAFRADQPEGAALLRCLSAAVHRPRAQPVRAVRHHGWNVRDNRNSHRGVHCRHGPSHQSLAAARGAAVQPGLRRSVRGNRDRVTVAQLGREAAGASWNWRRENQCAEASRRCSTSNRP